jgi:hypothetical protein
MTTPEHRDASHAPDPTVERDSAAPERAPSRHVAAAPSVAGGERSADRGAVFGPFVSADDLSLLRGVVQAARLCDLTIPHAPIVDASSGLTFCGGCRNEWPCAGTKLRDALYALPPSLLARLFERG